MGAIEYLRRLIARQPILGFAGVGVVSTVLDISLLNLLVQAGVQVYMATGAGFLLGATNGYVLNSLLVFHMGRSWRRFGKYLAISGVGLLLTELIVDQLHVRSGVPVNEAKLVAVGVVFFWNYTMSRLWAFKKTSRLSS